MFRKALNIDQRTQYFVRIRDIMCYIHRIVMFLKCTSVILDEHTFEKFVFSFLILNRTVKEQQQLLHLYCGFLFSCGTRT